MKSRVVTLFRLDLRTSAQVRDKKYLIPGLPYHTIEKHGVGLLIDEDGSIIGRMCSVNVSATIQ